MFRYRDLTISKKVSEKLKTMNLDTLIMHVCGTHQDTLVRYGLDNLLRDCGVEVRQGPGCPVCVTTTQEIEEAIALAERGKTVVSFGDMLRVPGENKSLLDIRTEGHDVRVVYSIKDAVHIAEKTGKEMIFLAIGFETTAPSTAVTILDEPPENFSILSCHRYIPPAIKALMEMGETKIEGIIDPGHVCTITGVGPYEEISEKYHVPQVVAGFEPLDVMMGVYMLSRQILKGEARVENEYSRSVRHEGNVKALGFIEEVFESINIEWRGFPVIPASGMELREEFQRYNARKIYEDELREVQETEFKTPRGCRCGEVLRGLVYPQDCPLFGKKCNPNHPVGPCMVSVEGSCNIEYKYGRRQSAESQN
jgi:hydrogenase expression/formation protein HypD